MIWIEMSRDETHGGGAWAFSKCIWAPTYKRIENSERKSSWLFWENVLRVKSGDIVIHLSGKGRKAAFVGYSTAESDGHSTSEKPPNAGIWAYSATYYRTFLKDYVEFSEPIVLHDLFHNKDFDFRDYHNNLPAKHKNIFYTIQSGRLQCLNGAYLSQANIKLLSLIFEHHYADTIEQYGTVSISEVWRQVKQRVGQVQFSNNVKNNYNRKCCFPCCTIDDEHYLVASHIARWADNPVRRGDTDNGLCFCLMHDKAFELGYFSLDDNFCICLSADPRITTSKIFTTYIQPYSNWLITLGDIKPAVGALKEHHERCSISLPG